MHGLAMKMALIAGILALVVLALIILTGQLS
jgi:hypothetical protein